MRKPAIFMGLHILADYEMEFAGGPYRAGEVVYLRDWVAEEMVRRGLARFVVEGGCRPVPRVERTVPAALGEAKS